MSSQTFEWHSRYQYSSAMPQVRLVSLRVSIPRLLNEGTTTMTARFAPALKPGPPSQTPGDLGLGQRYWSVSEVTWPPNLELRRWRSSGPSSLMSQNFTRCPVDTINWFKDTIVFAILGVFHVFQISARQKIQSNTKQNIYRRTSH